VSGGNAAWGGRSHGVHLLPDSVLMFANFGATNGKSAAIEYSLAGVEIARFEADLLTTVMGDVQRLPGGNTLVSYPVPSIMQEVNAAGEVVLQIDGGGPIFGYAVWRESLYGSPPDIVQ
jgi:hypothetical protein